MGKSSPATPAAPDPVQTANAQSQSNINTANATASLNHTNQYTPWGSQVYTSKDNPDGTKQWTSNITLSPEQQKLLDAQNGQSLGLSNLATSQMGNVEKALANPVDFSKAPTVQNNALVSNVNPGQIQSGIKDAGGIQKSLRVSPEDLRGAMQDNQGAAYRQQSAYLDKDYGRRQGDLENKLIQQGVTQGSDAWNRAMGSLGEQRTFDYNNAFNNSFSTGLAANNQLFNQDLESGKFVNSAQAQQYGQNANDAAFANTAQAQQFGQGLANAGLNNQTAAQAFSQSSADRARSLQEQSQQQQIPLNLLNALRTGSQVTSPSFGGTPQGNVGGTDIASMYNNQYQGQIAGYNGQVATNNANTQAGASLAAAAATAAMMY